jgi:eukaryotic-like serine/threonine-protein kinase
MGNGIKRFYEFGPYRVDPGKDLLLRAGEPIPLTSKAFQTLLLLVENNNQVLSKDQLMKALWPDTFVEESNLTKHISMVRKALGQTAQDHGYILTVPGRGYRFAESVQVISEDGSFHGGNGEHRTADVSAGLAGMGYSAANAGTAQLVGGRKRWRPILVVLLLIVAGAIAGNLYRRSRSPEPLTEKDTVVLIDFINSTGDTVFDDTLKQGLSVSLNQSPFLNVLSDNRVDATLQQMARPANSALTADMARELCQRAGSKAYIAGSIASLGSQYVLGLKAVDCQNGDTLAEEQTTGPTKEKVLVALDGAAARLRAKLGESLATVQKFDAPLEQATTSSLEALKAYSLGRKESREEGPRVALPYDQRSTQLDPNFAMGYFALGYDYFSLDEVGQASQYFTKAFQLREHTSEREKMAITAAYYQSVTGELDKAVQTYREQVESYPRDSRAYLDLGIAYGQQGRYDKAVEAMQQALRLAPDNVAPYENLAYELLASQRFDEARQAAQQAQARNLDDYVLRQVLYALAFLSRDSQAMGQQGEWFMGKPTVENSGLSLMSDTAAYSGHLRQARELTARAADSAIRSGHKESAAMWEANRALREAAFGDSVAAGQAADHALQILPTSQGVLAEAALAFAMTGDRRGESLARDLAKRFPLDTQTQSLWLPTIQAQSALDRKNPVAAISRLQAAVPLDLASVQSLSNVSCLYSIYLRGEAYLAADDGGAAAVQFQKILDHSGLVWNCWTGALARLGLARARAIEARKAQSDTAAGAATANAIATYRDFLVLWKDADPEIPVFKRARQELAALESRTVQ